MKKLFLALMMVLAMALNVQAESVDIIAGAFAMGPGNIPEINGNGDQFNRLGPLDLTDPMPYLGPGQEGAQSIGFDFGFFGPVGIYTTSVPVLSLDGSDLSGWTCAWSANTFNMGATNVNTVDNGDGTWTMDWSSTVVGGPFAGQVGNFILKVVAPIFSPYASVAIEVTGGLSQECTILGGSDISATAVVTLINGAELDYITWSLDGEYAGSGESLDVFTSLGAHTLQAMVTLIDGTTNEGLVDVQIEDTTPPELYVAFIDKKTGEEVTSINDVSAKRLMAYTEATDICDPAPMVEVNGGFALSSGDVLKLKGKADKVVIKTPELRLLGVATDASGNTAAASTNFLRSE